MTGPRRWWAAIEVSYSNMATTHECALLSACSLLSHGEDMATWDSHSMPPTGMTGVGACDGAVNAVIRRISIGRRTSIYSSLNAVAGSGQLPITQCSSAQHCLANLCRLCTTVPSRCTRCGHLPVSAWQRHDEATRVCASHEWETIPCRIAQVKQRRRAVRQRALLCVMSSKCRRAKRERAVPERSGLPYKWIYRSHGPW